MMREKGFSYCGLACCLCSENADCAGCRNGGCSEREWCNIQKCCRKKGLRGCWECESFPCAEPMLNKPRIKTFVKLIRDLGEQELTDCLERNERNGIVYHDKGQLVGDYDRCGSEQEIENLVKNGKSV